MFEPNPQGISQIGNREGGRAGFVKGKVFVLDIWGAAPRF